MPSWLALSVLTPTLPDHCEPTSDFLFNLSSTFHTCIPTPLAFLSQLLGTLSILAWLFAQLPQIYKNYTLSSTSGLSIFFLVEWWLGDFSNLLGAAFTHQASWQVIIGGYYVFVDLCLVGQWIWYERLRHGKIVRRIRRWSGNKHGEEAGDGPDGMVIEGFDPDSETASPEPTTHRALDKKDNAAQPNLPIDFRFPKPRTDDEKSSTTPNGTTIHRIGTPSSSSFSPSPRTVLLIACLMALAQATPIHYESHSTLHRAHTHHHTPTPLENAGTILSWLSSLLYLGSRLPQLYKNYRLQSTAGLSPSLFAAAFCGNLFYSSALVANPSAWQSFPAYGGGGWVGAGGSDRAQWVAAAFPFWLGAAGVLVLDASVGVQFWMYGETKEVLVVEEEVGKGRKKHWRRVSGWLRGWVPGVVDAQEVSRGTEEEALVGAQRQSGYGTA